MPFQITEALDNLFTTTWELRRREVVDNIFNATPLWFWLSDRGRRRTVRGHRYITIPLMYGKNTTVSSFGRGDTFSIADSEFLTTAIYEWKYIGGSITRFWVEDQKNRDKAQIIDLVDRKIEDLRLSLIDKLEEVLFGDGTGNGGKDPNGLRNIIRSTAPTGPGQDVVGQIDAYTETWWQNKRKTASGAFSTYGISDMRNLFNSCSVGNDTPDFIITSQAVYEAYEDELLEIHRIIDKRMADAGFEALSFKGKPITWSPRCPEGTMYFINSKYLEWVADEFANFDMTEWKPVQNSLDRVAQIVVAGNLCVSNRRMLGVLTNITV